MARGDDQANPTPAQPSGFLQVALGACTIAVLQLAGLGLSFVLSVVLARWLGSDDFGYFVYVVSWVVLLAVAGSFGLDVTVVRQLPVYAARADWGSLRGLLRWANVTTLIVSAAGVGIALLWLSLARTLGPVPAGSWLLVGTLIPLLALLRLAQSSLRGLHRPTWSQLPDVLVPALMLAVVAIAAWSGAGTAGADEAFMAQNIATAVALVFALGLVYRAMPSAARRAAPRYHRRDWLSTSGRMLALSGLTLLSARIGILMIGVMATPDAVGPYAAALRGVSFIALGFNVTVLALGPAIAAASAAGQTGVVEMLARRISQMGLLTGIPIAISFLLWGRSYLQLYGPEFETALGALSILALGEVVNVAAGPVATLLVMTGRERQALSGLAIGTVVNGGLCLILIPHWGITGAAVAGATGTAVWNIVLWRLVRRELGIAPNMLGLGPRQAPTHGG